MKQLCNFFGKGDRLFWIVLGSLWVIGILLAIHLTF